MQEYKHRPTTVEAIQWDGNNYEEIVAEIGAENFQVGPLGHGFLRVAANNAWVEIEKYEWILRDSLGYYPNKDGKFNENYEAGFVTRKESDGQTAETSTEQEPAEVEGA